MYEVRTYANTFDTGRGQEMKAWVIPAAVEEPLRQINFEKHNELDALQTAVGGIVEFVRISRADRYRLVVDEEGRLKDKEMNMLASILYPGIIAGDAVLIGWHGDTVNGDTEIADSGLNIEPDVHSLIYTLAYSLKVTLMERAGLPIG